MLLTTSSQLSIRSCFVMRSFLVYYILASFQLSFWTATAEDSIPKLLIISMDGFGWNFLGKLPKSDLPNFEAFMKKGAHVKWVENVFPTMTDPNHMSLVSGLYAESHGIVSNKFFDPVLNASFPKEGNLTEEDSAWMDVGAEPVWVTNSLAGKGRRSGTVLWPRADAKIKGRLPEEQKRGGWSVDEEDFSAKDRVNLAVDWLTREIDPLNFVALYFPEPDEISHHHGPDSQEVLDCILSRDKALGYLMTQLKEKKLEEELNIIITADHGQVRVFQGAVINLDLMVDPSWYTSYSLNHRKYPAIVAGLWPNEGYHQAVVDGLRGRHLNLHVAVGDDNPDLVELHNANNRRNPPILLWPETGWVIGTNDTNHSAIHIGEHGYDPRYSPHMYPFFIAQGPAFKTGLRNAAPFSIVDIYPLMCHILGLTPAPNNGSLSKTAHLLKYDPFSSSFKISNHYTAIAVGSVLAVILLVVIVALVKYIRKSKSVTASYKRAFSRAGAPDGLMAEEGMTLVSDDDL